MNIITLLVAILICSILYSIYNGRTTGVYIDEMFIKNLAVAIVIVVIVSILLGAIEGFDADMANTGLKYNYNCPRYPVFGQKQFENIQFTNKEIDKIVADQEYNRLKVEEDAVVLRPTQTSVALDESRRRNILKQEYSWDCNPEIGKSRGRFAWNKVF